MLESPLGCTKRYPPQIEHREHVRIAQLVLQREANDIELAQRRIALKRQQRNSMLSQPRFHIGPGRVDSFGCPALMLVQQTVEYLQPEMAHPDLIGVGKA